MQFCVLGQHTEFIIAVSGQTPLILKSLPRISNALTSSTSITEFISFSVKLYILSDWPFCMSSSFLSISVEMRIYLEFRIYFLIQYQILLPSTFMHKFIDDLTTAVGDLMFLFTIYFQKLNFENKSSAFWDRITGRIITICHVL